MEYIHEPASAIDGRAFVSSCRLPSSRSCLLDFGIAAGAMVWMVFAELIPDANKNASSNTVGITVTLAFAFMIAFQYLVLR